MGHLLRNLVDSFPSSNSFFSFLDISYEVIFASITLLCIRPGNNEPPFLYFFSEDCRASMFWWFFSKNIYRCALLLAVLTVALSQKKLDENCPSLACQVVSSQLLLSSAALWGSCTLRNVLWFESFAELRYISLLPLNSIHCWIFSPQNFSFTGSVSPLKHSQLFYRHVKLITSVYIVHCKTAWKSLLSPLFGECASCHISTSARRTACCQNGGVGGKCLALTRKLFSKWNAWNRFFATFARNWILRYSFHCDQPRLTTQYCRHLENDSDVGHCL